MKDENTDFMSRMNPLVTVMSERVFEEYASARVLVSGYTEQQLTELEHEMEHLRYHPDFSIRTGAEIVRAAAVLEREGRNNQQPNR